MIHPNKQLAGGQGVLQADAYSDYKDLYLAERSPRPASSALCLSHARRKFFELADIAENEHKNKPTRGLSPFALQAVKRVDTVFEIEPDINGMDAAVRLSV